MATIGEVMDLFRLNVSGNAPRLYPVNLFFGMLCYSPEGEIGIPKLFPFSGEWGQPLSTICQLQDDYPIPTYLDLIYLSIIERKFYSVEKRISKEKLKTIMSRVEADNVVYENLIVGMSPYGGVAVWANGEKKAEVLEWIHGEETIVDMTDFMSLDPSVTLDQNCDFYINNDPAVKDNLEKYGLPPRNLYDKYMQQFSYRYVIQYAKWNNDIEKWTESEEGELIPELDSIEEALFDGTHDKLNDGSLMQFHQAGKPKKLALKWHVNKNESVAYFWFHDDEIKTVFERMYGPHTETKTDFIIRIDSQQDKYELSMFRYGMKEPYIIPEDVYELIVFNNGFEAFRSENYNQPKGAWIW